MEGEQVHPNVELGHFYCYRLKKKLFFTSSFSDCVQVSLFFRRWLFALFSVTFYWLSSHFTPFQVRYTYVLGSVLTQLAFCFREGVVFSKVWHYQFKKVLFLKSTFTHWSKLYLFSRRCCSDFFDWLRTNFTPFSR